MITSISNRQVKNVIKLAKKPGERKSQGVFLVEGVRMFREISREQIVRVYVSEGFLRARDGAPDDVDLGGMDLETVSDAVFRQMSDTKTPQGILAVVRQPVYGMEQLLYAQPGKRPLLLVLENIQDPGNLGSMFRTGEGAGVTGIVMSRDCADLFAPKAVRATMGSICRVPFTVSDDMPRTVAALKDRGVAVYAAHLEGSRLYDGYDYKRATAFLVGNEGNGLTGGVSGLADGFVRIPMGGKLESLNAAMAAGILLYEADRQRRISSAVDLVPQSPGGVYKGGVS